MMNWFKVCNSAHLDPRFLAIPLPYRVAAFGVFIGALGYANDHQTDGFVPNGWRLYPDIQQWNEIRQHLIGVGLWTAGTDGVTISRFLRYQRSRKDASRDRKNGSKRVITHRLRHVTPLQGHDVTPLQGHDVTRYRVDPVTPLEKRREEKNVHDPSSTVRTKDSLSSKGARDSDSLSQSANPPVSSESLRWFDRVYAAYPNKDRKMAANTAWVQLGPSEAVAGSILANVTCRQEAGWARIERRFIPQLVTFLRERMWEDDPGKTPDEEDLELIIRESGDRTVWECQTCGDMHMGTHAQMRARWCERADQTEH